jgi:hypothetical protein
MSETVEPNVISLTQRTLLGEYNEEGEIKTKAFIPISDAVLTLPDGVSVQNNNLLCAGCLAI